MDKRLFFAPPYSTVLQFLIFKTGILKNVSRIQGYNLVLNTGHCIHMNVFEF